MVGRRHAELTAGQQRVWLALTQNTALSVASRMSQAVIMSMPAIGKVGQQGHSAHVPLLRTATRREQQTLPACCAEVHERLQSRVAERDGFPAPPLTCTDAVAVHSSNHGHRARLERAHRLLQHKHKRPVGTQGRVGGGTLSPSNVGGFTTQCKSTSHSAAFLSHQPETHTGTASGSGPGSRLPLGCCLPRAPVLASALPRRCRCRNVCLLHSARSAAQWGAGIAWQGGMLVAVRAA